MNNESPRIVVTAEAHRLARLLAATLETSVKQLVSELIEKRSAEFESTPRSTVRRKHLRKIK